MKIKEVPSPWITRWGNRLDAGPYLSGAVDARMLMESPRFRASKLSSVTSAIYHAGREGRRWVSEAKYGVPFLSSSDIQRADLSNLPLISKAQVKASPGFLIRRGWTLITRSGTIGRMVYVRPDMDGMACSEHAMRVVPNEQHIRPGYLFAFLRGRYGIPMVIGGTYGSIIQSIEPEHLAGLPVPRISGGLEDDVHALVEKAARLRTHASKTLREVALRFDRLTAHLELTQQSPRVASVLASALPERFDAQYHDPVVAAIRTCLKQDQHTTIGQWCKRVFLPGIFKRIHVDDARRGAPYYTGSSLFSLEPVPKATLSPRTSLFHDVLMESGTVLVQAFGQEGGLTGRAVWVGKHLDGAATTHMLVRLESRSREDSAYLFGFLQSEAAYRQIASVTYGGSIPHFDESGISRVIVPLLNDEERSAIAKAVLEAVDARDEALSDERTAREMVETAIEGAM